MPRQRLLACVFLFLSFQRSQSEDVLCVTGAGDGGGGLANTLAFVNTLLDFALQHNATFLSFPLHVHAHNDGTADRALNHVLTSFERAEKTAMVDDTTVTIPAAHWRCPNPPTASQLQHDKHEVNGQGKSVPHSPPTRCSVSSLRFVGDTKAFSLPAPHRLGDILTTWPHLGMHARLGAVGCAGMHQADG
jgi:hypothetical protein